MSELPAGWIRTTLAELGDGRRPAVKAGPFGSALKKEFYTKTGYRVYGQEQVIADRFDVGDYFIDQERFEKLRSCEVQPGDVLVSLVGTFGRASVVPPGTPIGIINPRLIRLSLNRNAVDPQFLKRFLGSPAVQQRFEAVAHGGTMGVLNATTVGPLPLSLPPLNEQRRIVAKLEALQGRSRRAREALDAVPPLLEKLRQSILAAAFRGDLTKDWRAKHKDVEPASELLERIRTERRKKWEEAELAKMKAKGKEPPDDKWKAKYKEPEPVDATGLPELPKGWCWASPDELSAPVPNALTIGPFGSDLRVNDYRDDGVALVFVRDIRAERFGGEKTKFVSADKAAALSRHLVQSGDLLMTKMGDPPGDTAVYPAGLAPAVITADCIKLTPFASLTDAPFLKYCFRAQVVRTQLLEQTAGVAQQKLSLERFRTVHVPLPPREEQLALVEMLEASLASTAAGAHQVNDLLRRLTELERACLAKAFRGELVPQDPNDEPAEAMLVRVRAADGAATNGASTETGTRHKGRRATPESRRGA